MKRDAKLGKMKVRDEAKYTRKLFEIPVKEEPHPLPKGDVSFSTPALFSQNLWRILKQLLGTCYD